MSEGELRRNGTFVNKAAGLVGIAVIAFGAGDFIGQWRVRSGLESEIAALRSELESEIAALRSEIAVLRATVMFHNSKDGHSEVIERLTVLETRRSFRSPLGDIE